MVYTQDPEWPCVAVTGNLPKLVVHVSEQKVFNLMQFFILLFEKNQYLITFYCCEINLENVIFLTLYVDYFIFSY